MEDDSGLQRFVESLFAGQTRVSRLDAIVRAEAYDLDMDLREIVGLLPPGTYTRQRLCNQLNSAIIGHCWTERYRTVE